MTLALTPVMLLAAGLLYVTSSNIAETQLRETIRRGVKLTYEDPKILGADTGRIVEGVTIFPNVSYGNPPRLGEMYRYKGDDETKPAVEMLVPKLAESAGEQLLKVIAATMLLVLLVGAGVALWAANQVTRPIELIIDDVRQISKGDLQHPIHATGMAEIQLLARSIDRMKSDLAGAQEAELELSIREREVELATDVRDALLPVATPLIEGYDLGAVHISSSAIGGDFHDYIELEDDRVGLLVCEVSGKGMPAALIGATARSYLRSELTRAGGDPTAMTRVNAWLGEDVKKGVYVTALYALVDPAGGRAAVVCAGHKVPLLRYAAEDGTLRTIQPDGIALGLDRGPVFERRLQVVEIPLEVGDRLFLCNSGPLLLQNPEGRELGEKAFFGRVLKHAQLESLAFLKALRRDLEQFAGEGGIPHDISLVTISRPGQATSPSSSD
ncbi:MAG: SpoIIE family protein phosphatase [Planctomycetota bacterium]|nr:SpoIIE family protein phosphatase [Planctomycetota bacterium]